MLRVDPKEAIQDHVSGKAASAQTPRKLSLAAAKIAAAPVEPTLSSVVISGVAQFVEAAGLAVLGFAIYAGYVEGSTHGFYLPIIFGAVVLANVFFNLAHTHRVPAYRSLTRQTMRVLAAWSLVFVFVAMGAFLLKMSDQVSRVWLVTWYASGAAWLVAFRMGLRALVWRWTKQGRLKRRTVIVGGGPDAEELIKSIRESADNDIELFGLFDDRLDERSPDVVADCSKLGKVADLIEFARQTQLDLVIVSMPLSAEKRVLEMLKQLWVLPVDIRLSAHMSKLRFTSKAYSFVGDVPVFDMADRPISDWNLVFKWVFDKVVALTAIILLSPVMILTAIAIKLDSPGPIFFRQKRHGFNNELIEIFKFRSMRVEQLDTNASKLVTKDDPRVTEFGRFIRKTSIDELPQLLNVLLGHLSIVGPRPHALQAKAANRLYHEAVDGYFARHKVKPGMTGWAQIHGWRGETDTLEKIMQRVHHDLYYIENWSPLLDFYIVLLTPFALISNKHNAY